MGTPSEEEVLAGIKRLILEENRAFLCRYMNPERYLNYMRSKFVINEEDKEEIEYEKTRRQRASVMIDIILRKGGNAYDVFVQAIQLDRTQTHLVSLLHTEYEKRRNNYLALVNQPDPDKLNIDEQSLPKPAPPPQTTTVSGPSPVKRDCVPPPTVRPTLSSHPGRRQHLLQMGSQPNVYYDPTVPSNTKETIYTRESATAAPPIRTENPRPIAIPTVVDEEEHGETSSTNQNTAYTNRPIEDNETESMKEKKEQTNRQKLKFTSRSADNAEDQETHRKEILREGEEHSESMTMESFVSTDSSTTEVKEIFD